MKKIFILLLFLLPIISFSQSKITFSEQDREFTLSTYGGLEFSYYSGDRISRDYDGKPTKIGPVNLRYNYDGKPTKIGSVSIRYNYDGQPTKIGGLSIYYDYDGRVTRTSGSVK